MKLVTPQTTPINGQSIRIEGISKTFSSHGGTMLAVDDVALSVRPGEFLAIVGPSGCGKSTLLQIIAGLIPPTSGRVFLGDKDVTAQPAHMVYLFQQYSKSLLPWMNVEENVMFSFTHREQLSKSATNTCRWSG